MEGLIALVLLLLLAAMAVSPLLFIVALRRIRKVEERLRKVDELEREMFWLRRRIEQAEQQIIESQERHGFFQRYGLFLLLSFGAVGIGVTAGLIKRAKAKEEE